VHLKLYKIFLKKTWGQGGIFDHSYGLFFLFAFFLFFCLSPFAVVLTVSQGQQTKRYRFDVYVFTATGDDALAQLCVLIASSRGENVAYQKDFARFL
jgi:hypothetical protein